MPDDDKKALLEKLKKELAELEFEEQILRKRDERLKWERQMIEQEERLKEKGQKFFSETSSDTFARSTESHKTEEVKSNYVLEPGSTYLLFEERPLKSIDLFLKEIEKGMAGLFITRSNPKHIQKKYDLAKTKLCWLTGVKAADDVVSVSGLQELSILVSNQIDESTESVILLDGIEYLISNNDFSIVLRLIQQIRDKVSTSEAKMLIPVNSQALDAKQATLLERECQKIG